MKQKQRDAIQERLLEERQSRIEALVEFDERFRDRAEISDNELTHYPLHMADDGTDTIEQEKEVLLASQEGRQLLDIDDALRKLYKEPERFGSCEQCGGEIGEARLDLVPWARLCIDCKRAEEEGATGESAA